MLVPRGMPPAPIGGGQLLSRFCGMSHGYSLILRFLSSGVFPTSFFNPTAALHSSSVDNRYSLSSGRSPPLRSRFVNHLQNSSASFQLTPTTGWFAPWLKPGSFHVAPRCLSPSLPIDHMPPVAS